MKLKTLFLITGGAVSLLLGSNSVFAALDASGKVCSDGTQDSFVFESQVTTNETGVADDCYGVFEGNEPKAEGIDTDGDGVADFTWLAKYEMGGVEGDIDFSGGGGTWSFAEATTFDGSWLFLIKQGSCWAAYEFAGGTYSGGTYSVGFGTREGACVGTTSDPFTFSHLSIYGTLGEPTDVPEPGTLALLGLGLMGLGFARRKTSG